MLSPVFEQFANKSPISVMARGMMERVLNPSQLDQWFNETAEQQYTKELMFSTVFDLMSQVVCGSRHSVHAAYQASTEDIGVSITSVYNKLNGIETNTSAELVRFAAKQVEPIVIKLGGTTRSPLPGLRIKLLDGNCIEKSQHRIKGLRSISAGPLPGKSSTHREPADRVRTGDQHALGHRRALRPLLADRRRQPHLSDRYRGRSVRDDGARPLQREDALEEQRPATT